jgi:hypothetical protein
MSALPPNADIAKRIYEGHALGTFGSLRPCLPLISFLEVCVLAGIAARNVDRELGEQGGIVGVLAVACQTIIVPPREDLRTVGLEMGHVSASVHEAPHLEMAQEDPQLFNHGGGLLLARTRTHTHTGTSASGLGDGVKRPALDDSEPRTFLNLYKIAHSESMVDKLNNSTSSHRAASPWPAFKAAADIAAPRAAASPAGPP